MQVTKTVEETRKQNKDMEKEGKTIVLFQQWDFFMRDMQV